MSSTTIETEYGDIVVEDARWMRDVTFTIGEHASIEVRSPSVTDQASPATLYCRYGFELNEEQFDAFAGLYMFVSRIVTELNRYLKSDIEAAKQREEEEEVARKAAEEAREAITQERTERLLHEFIGDRVKIRHRGYKTMCYGTVSSREVGLDENEEPVFEVRIRYSDQGYTRDMGVPSFQRLDVKTEEGWKTVWDDGTDDLPERDRGVKLPEVKPYG
jgi:hypothetical protein